MKQTYLLLFNYETKADQANAQKLMELLPKGKAIMENYAIFADGEKNSKWKASLWVTSDIFLAAWVYSNQKAIHHGICSFEEGMKYLEDHLNNKQFQLVK